jgi:hypothetical protein
VNFHLRSTYVAGGDLLTRERENSSYDASGVGGMSVLCMRDLAANHACSDAAVYI